MVCLWTIDQRSYFTCSASTDAIHQWSVRREDLLNQTKNQKSNAKQASDHGVDLLAALPFAFPNRYSLRMVASHPGSARLFFRFICITFLLLAVVFAVSCSLVHAQEDDSTTAAASTEDTGDSSSTSSGTSDSSSSPPKETRRPSSGDEDDWGSFYDPNNVFCGKFDCYKILGFDHETWGSDPPSLKAITKSYRNLSRVWHPDKNKAKGAREKFVVSRTF